MVFTEEDIPLMKLIFNPSTHDMGMLIGGERAENILNYVCENIHYWREGFIYATPDFLARILIDENICNFFWDNNIINLKEFRPVDIYRVLRDSPIAEKIWDSNKLDLTKLDRAGTYWILTDSPIAKKIWDSGKLDLSLLSKRELKSFKNKFKD